METTPLRILLIENDLEFIRSVNEMLGQVRGTTFVVEACAQFETGLARLKEGGWDLALIDLLLPDGAGLANIERAQAEALEVPIIVLGSVDDEAVAIEAVHVGAQDYLVKSQLNAQFLARTIRYSIERQRADAALLDAERKYRGIFENIVEGIFQTSPDGRYLSANPALARIYGYSTPAELISSITDIARKIYVKPGRRAEFIQIMKEHDTVTDFESRIYRKDQSIIWIAENVRAIRDSSGQLLYYEGTVEDITLRKQAEEKLMHSQELYHSLVETLPQNIFRKDSEGRFTFVNDLFCKSLGRTEAEILGKTDFDFFPRELALKYQKDDQRIFQGEKVLEMVEEHRPPSGEVLQVQVIKKPLHDATGRVIGLQGIFWDISERMRAEERIRMATTELARSQEELRETNQQMKEDLVMAREIQISMLPQQYPTFPKSASLATSRFQFCHRYRPTGTGGGDYFNVLALSKNEAGVFICDVMGHGVRSALVAAMVRAIVEELKPLGKDPGKLLSHLNRDLCSILKQAGSPMLTTAFYLVADAETGIMRYANAGHPKPFLLHRDRGEVEQLNTPRGKGNPALGLFDGAAYDTAESKLNPDDLLMLYTDGLYEVEGRDKKLFTTNMLMDAMQRNGKLPAAELLDQLLKEIKEFGGGREFEDDVCILSLEVAKQKPIA